MEEQVKKYLPQEKNTTHLAFSLRIGKL